MELRVIFLAGMAVALFVVNVLGQSSDQITGRWAAKELNNSVIEITKTNNVFTGTIIRSDKPQYLNRRVIYNVTYNPEQQVYQGTIYSISRDMELKGTFTREGEKLKVVGGKLFITKTFFWEPYSK